MSKSAEKSGAEGSDPGTPSGSSSHEPPAGFVSADALEAERARAKSFQSAADKKDAELAELRQRFAAIEESVKQFSPEVLAKTLSASLAKERSIEETRSTLTREFGEARPEVLAASYDTPEELRAAVEASHRAESERLERARTEERARIAAELKEKHGFDLPAPTQPNSGETQKPEVDLTKLRGLALLDVSDDDLAALSQ